MGPMRSPSSNYCRRSPHFSRLWITAFIIHVPWEPSVLQLAVDSTHQAHRRSNRKWVMDKLYLVTNKAECSKFHQTPRTTAHLNKLCVRETWPSQSTERQHCCPENLACSFGSPSPSDKTLHISSSASQPELSA